MKLGERKMLHALIAMVLAGGASTAIAQQGDDLRADILGQMQTLYGLDEEGAIERLAAEDAAADVYQVASQGAIPGYAGAWFDAGVKGLVIAINDPASAEQVEQIGGRAVLVAHSLAELEVARSRVDALNLPDGAFRTAYIDFKLNTVVLGVTEEHVAAVTRMVADAGDSISVIASDEVIQLSANVRGAEGTRNDTWAATYGGVYLCSTGATNETGYYTAGHCGETGDVFRTPGGTLLGTMNSSGLFDFYGSDIGRVTTAVGQTPKPWVNGYTAGQLTVSAKWGGLRVSPVGTTTCRYGQTSGGPHCGTVNALNLTTSTVGYVINGVTRVAGSCSDDGDSGGTWLSSSDNQIQGTTIGATTTNTCPTPSTYTYFQAIGTHLASYSQKVLTAHGAVAPTESGLQCPVADLSGLGTWYCKFDWWNSQGAATFSWSAGTAWPAAGGGLQVRGNCSGGTVNVNLTITNSYGTYTVPRSFACPLGPIP